MILRDLTFNEVLNGHSYLSFITTYTGGPLLVDAANAISASITGETNRLCFMAEACRDMENMVWEDIQNHLGTIHAAIRAVIEQKPIPKGHTEHWKAITDRIEKC